MAMSKQAKFGLTIAAAATATAVLTYVSAKREIKKRCRKQVKKGLSEIPFVPQSFIDEQADEVCDI